MTTSKTSKVINASNCVTSIDLLRHGATEGDDIFRGSIDVPLSTAGWQQMQTSVGNYAQWQFLVSSPLQRCQLFANQLGEKLSMPVMSDMRLREMSFGDWEGRRPDDVWQETPEVLKAFWADPDKNPPPQGERLSVFQARVIDGLQDVVNTFRGQHGLIVCHGGVVRLLIAHVLSIPLHAAMRIQVPFACVSRIHIYHHETEDDVMSLLFHNGKLE